MGNPLVTPAVVTVYGKDGTKVRKPVGIPGGACHLATQPYEAREIPGQVKKTPTPEAYEDNAPGVKVDDRLTTEG